MFLKLIKKEKYNKILKIYDIRWLSRFNAIKNFHKSLPGVLVILNKNINDNELK